MSLLVSDLISLKDRLDEALIMIRDGDIGIFEKHLHVCRECFTYKYCDSRCPFYNSSLRCNNMYADTPIVQVQEELEKLMKERTGELPALKGEVLLQKR